MKRRQICIVILPIFLVVVIGLILNVFFFGASSVSQNTNPLEPALAYLKDISQIQWYEIENNTVYLGFTIVSDHCYIVTDAAALRGSEAINKEFLAWAVNAAHKGWRPDRTPPGKGPLYGRAVANNGHLVESSKAAQNISDRKTLISKFLSQGVIHSINIELNEVRVNLFIWALWPIETKQQFVLICEAYFADYGNPGRVTILSNRNDNQLATYSSGSRIKILE